MLSSLFVSIKGLEGTVCMWKKILISLFTLVGAFSVAYSYHEKNLEASPVTTNTYVGVGENFERTNSSVFEMGGIKWRLIYADPDTHEGYIGAENISTQCDLHTSSYVESRNVTKCMQQLTSLYQASNRSDDTGKSIQIIGNKNELSLMSLDAYNEITKNETDTSTILSALGNEIWLDAFTEDNYLGTGIKFRLSFWPDGTPYVPFKPYKYLTYWSRSSFDGPANFAINPVFKIKLPMLGYIKTITSSIMNKTIEFISDENAVDTLITEIDTTEGKGPYHFYVYDTDSIGSGDYTIPSSYFKIDADSTKGTAKVYIKKDQLNAGDYYFKVKVIDESTETMYYAPDDFTKDSYRTKETGVIHLTVNKGTQDPLKIYGSSDERNNAVNAITTKTIDMMQNDVTLYPAGGSIDVVNTSYKYEIISDPNTIFSNVPSEGSTGTFTLTHQKGTAKVKVTKPGNENYNEVSAFIEITTAGITEHPEIIATQRDNITSYKSGDQYNDDVIVTFQRLPGSTVTRDLKLKELTSNKAPSDDWYKTSGTESTITSGDTKTVTASSTQTYVCYWLYYDGYLNEGVEFRVDLLKDNLKIKNPQTPSAWLAHNDVITTSGNSFDLTSANHTLDTTKTKLFEQGNTNKTYPLTNVGEGTYTLHLEDAYGNETELDFKVLASLYFVKVNTDTKIIKDEIEYDKDGIYRAQAKGSSNTIKYRVSDGKGLLQATDTSGEFKMLKIGTVEVEAYTEDASGTTLSSVKMNVTITKGLQSLTFDDTNLSKRVKKGSAKFFETATGKRTTLNKAGVGGIKYSSSDTSVIDIDPDTGEVTVGNKGTATIKAILNDPTSSSYDANYETKTITKTIEVYEGMSATFTATSLQAEKSAILNANAGTFTPTNNNGAVTYKISASLDPKNKDKDYFKMNGSTLQLTKAVNGSELSKHVGGNIFKVQVNVTDQDGTVTIDCEITIADAENDFYFVNAKDVTEKITSISEVYGLNETIQLQTHTSNGGTVTYKLKDNEDESIINVATNGIVTMLKTGGPVLVEATVTAGSGYAGKTIELPITITKSTYKIAWQKPNTTYVKYSENVSVEEKAVLTPAGSIAYEPLTSDICEIDVNGTVTALKEGTCEIKAKSTNSNYEEATTTKEVIFFTGAQGTFTQTNTPQAGNAPISTTIGTAQIIGIDDTSDYKYTINSESNNKNTDQSLFQVSEDYGTVSLKQAVSAETLKDKTYDAAKGGYPLLVQVIAKNDVTQDQVIIDCEVIIKGAKMSDVSFKDDEGNATSKITKEYLKNGSFTVDLINNTGGTPKYTFKSGPEDVIAPTITGNMINILHANEKTNLTNVVIQAEIPAKNGYEPTTVTCVVVITQAEQKNFQFKDKKIQMLPNSKIEVELEGKETPGPTTLKSDDKSIVSIDTDKVTLVSKEKEATTTITATHKGDRDYKDGKATLQVEVTNTPAYPFEIDVSDATYGDEPYLAEVTQSQPTTGAQITRTWTSSDESVATIDPLTGEITIIGAGSTTISCVQTSSIDPDVKDSIVLNVAAKPIEIIIDDQEKYVGEAVPEFTVQIPTEELVGSDTLDQPTYTCVDTNGLSVSETTGKGSYDIQASYPASKYSNYEITFVKGTLTIHQDESSEAWYELRGKDTSNVIDNDTWVNEAVYVALQKTESDPYDEISLNGNDWDHNHILVEIEGITKSDVYFQKSGTNALATNQNTTIKIDTTKPEITSITGEEIKQDEISKLLNQLTFGNFFKPQDEITIQAQDIQPKGVSDISGLKEVHYRIYPINKKTGLPEAEVYDEDTITANMETIKFKVDDIGLYRICAIATDHAGNSSTTKCSDINVKEIDVDKDGDQIPDMNDSDHDGCPDLNIVLGTDSKGNKVKLNVAEEGKNYPYMNIDSNGDGKADLNIDTDHDGKPDLNLVIMSDSAWKPKTCVLVEKLKDYSNPIEYCTGTDVKPQINVDTTGNGIPNINIDTDGDMVANINIDTTGDAKPNVNINTLETWMPNKDYTIQGFSYDTMSELKPYLNIDSDGDGRPDINVDVNGDGTADLNIDTDNDGIPNIDIDSTGDGEPDINVDTTGDGTPDKNIVTITEWIPKKDCESDGFKYDTMEIKGNSELEDNGVIVEKPDGTFLPNYAIKVNDVTESKKEEVEKEATNQIKETQEVKAVYDVLLLENDVEVQPDGTLKVRIPIPEGITNPKLLVRRSNGSYETVIAKEENGYLVYETKELGTVTVIGDKAETPIDPKPTPDPEPTPTPEPNEPKAEEPNEQRKPTVQGIYYPGNNVGGASTGDASNIGWYLTVAFTSLGILSFLLYKKKEE